MADTPKRKIQPDALMPDIPKDDAEIKGEMYWIGALPSFPMNNINIAGIPFPIVTEIVRTNPANGETIRVPGDGVILRLTEQKVLEIADRLPRVLVRWRGGRREPLNTIPGDKGNDEEAVQNLPPRNGFIITIPSDADKEKMRRNQRVPMSAEPTDEPIANFIYMKKQAHRDAEVPAPLSQTGIPL
jgi:hypothetical protein